MAAFSNTVANHVVYKSGHQASILVCSVHSAQVCYVYPFWMRLMRINLVWLTAYTKGSMSTLNETSPIGRIVGYSLVWSFGFGCICALTTSLQVKLIAPMFIIIRARKSRRSSHRSPSGWAVYCYSCAKLWSKPRGCSRSWNTRSTARGSSFMMNLAHWIYF